MKTLWRRFTDYRARRLLAARRLMVCTACGHSCTAGEMRWGLCGQCYLESEAV